MTRLIASAALLVTVALTPPSKAQSPNEHADAAPTRYHHELVVVEGLGALSFPNSGAPEAQDAFNRGVLLLHSFEYRSAAEAFREAQALDPDFALAYWGEAMTYNHPIWEVQNRDAARAAIERMGETQEARFATAPTERERDLLAAIEVLYGEGNKEDRDDEYARFMEALHAKYPDDPEIAAFTALAILGTADEGRDFATYMRAAAIVEEVFDANPNHPGAAHYLIHSYDDPIHAPLGMRAARAYSQIAPDAAHAQHMCSHIFVASGLWQDVVDANLNAVAAASRARAQSGLAPVACGHPITWLNYGYLQLGEVEQAAELIAACHADAVAEDSPPPVFDPDLSNQASFLTMWARYLVDTEAFDSDIARLSIELRPDQVQERMTVAYMDGLEAAKRGDEAGVRSSISAVRELGLETARLAADADMTLELEATARSAVIEAQMEALLAQTQGDAAAAITHAREAARLEEQMPFMFGPPFIDKPSHELLGELLLAAGHRSEAEEAFRAALARTPGRKMAVKGLERAGE